MSWPVTSAVLAAAAALAAFPLAEAAPTTVTKYPDGSAVESSPLFGIEGLLRIGLAAALAAAVLTALIRLPQAARRRALVLALPVAAVAALVYWSVLLTAPQWAALGAVPVLALAAGMTLLTRHERTLCQAYDAGARGQASPPTT